MSHSFSESSSVPSMSHRTPRGSDTARSYIEVLRLRVVRHEGVGGLFGVQLQFVRQLHADAGRVEQVDDAPAVLHLRAGAVAERVTRAAVAELEELLDVGRVLRRDRLP